MKLSAEEVVVFLHTSIDKLSVLDFLDKRCRALEIADAEYVSALDNLLKNGMNDEYLECYADHRGVQHELETYQDLFIRVFENIFDDETCLSSYEYCHAAYTEVRQTLDRLNNLTNLTKREEEIRKTLREIESVIRRVDNK